MSTERELAEHGIEIKHIQNDVDVIMKDMDELKDRLDKIEQSLSKIEGGWKVFILIASAGSFLVSWLFNHWMK